MRNLEPSTVKAAPALRRAPANRSRRRIRPLNIVRSAFTVQVLCFLPVVGHSGDPALPVARGSAGRSPGVREYSPGIRIDWPRRTVELDATVVLREGALELLACSPHTREHESILTVRGRPRDIHHALGLVGLRPGSPARYDRVVKAVRAPRGDSMRIDIHYRVDGVERFVPAERWLRDSKRQRALERANWVFAGSTTIHDGRFGADVDGTVVCVVDFDTALVAVGESHSADNQLLWLEANTPEIPALGTACVLVLQGAEPVNIELEVAAGGSLRYEGRSITVGDVARLAARQGKDSVDTRIVLLRPASKEAEKALAVAVEALVRAGVHRGLIRTVGVASGRPGALSPNQPANR